jgi:multimeric flavodoxin WrbA
VKVIAFNGSPRPQGNTRRMLEIVLEELAKEGIDGEIYQLGGKLVHGCKACYQCFARKDGHCVVDDEINRCIELMAEADGVLIGSPTYFSNVSTETKALIDRAGLVARANPELLRRKPGAAVVSVRRMGGLMAFNAINQFFTILEMIVPGSTYWNVGFGGHECVADNDPEGVKTMRDLGVNMAWLMKKLKG